jgi:hypothetical protein
VGGKTRDYLFVDVDDDEEKNGDLAKLNGFVVVLCVFRGM